MLSGIFGGSFDEMLDSIRHPPTFAPPASTNRITQKERRAQERTQSKSTAPSPARKRPALKRKH